MKTNPVSLKSQMTKSTIISVTLLTIFLLFPEQTFAQRESTPETRQIDQLNRELQRQQQQQEQQQQREHRQQREQLLEQQRQNRSERVQRERAQSEQVKAVRQQMTKVSGLARVLQKEYDKQLKHLAINKEAKANLQALKEELLRESSFYGSDASRGVAILTRTINAICNLILDVVPAGSPNLTVDTLRAVIDKGLVDGSLDEDTIAKTIATAVAEDKAIAGREWRKLAFALKSFGERMAEIPNIDANQIDVKKEVSEQLKQIDKEMENYESKIQKTENLSKGLVRDGRGGDLRSGFEGFEQEIFSGGLLPDYHVLDN